MRTRDKLKIPVKIKCACGVRTTVGNATIGVGTRIDQTCKHCGSKIYRIIAQKDIDAAIKTFVEDRDFSAKLAAGEIASSERVSFYPDPKRDRTLPRTVPTPKRRKVRSDQIVGGAKLYHYAIYVRHPWGTDRIVIGIQDRVIQKARDSAWDRVSRMRKTGDLKIMDAVPMRWTSEGMVETRKTRITKGTLSNQRAPRSRASSRATKRTVNER